MKWKSLHSILGSNVFRRGGSTIEATGREKSPGADINHGKHHLGREVILTNPPIIS
jgi:hypothetical protein